MNNNTITLDRDNYERALKLLQEHSSTHRQHNKIDEAISYLLDGEITEDVPMI